MEMYLNTYRQPTHAFLETLKNQVIIFAISSFLSLVVLISTVVFSHSCDVLLCQVFPSSSHYSNVRRCLTSFTSRSQSIWWLWTAENRWEAIKSKGVNQWSLPGGFVIQMFSQTWQDMSCLTLKWVLSVQSLWWWGWCCQSFVPIKFIFIVPEYFYLVKSCGLTLILLFISFHWECSNALC